MRRKINLIGYPQFTNDRLTDHQKKEFKQLKSRFRKQSKQNKVEMYASSLKGIKPNAWNLMFYDFSDEQLSEFKQMVEESNTNQINVFFLNSRLNFLHWLDNTEFEQLGFIGSMNIHATYLLISGDITHKVFPMALIGLTEVLRKLPDLGKYTKEAKNDMIYCYKATPEKELIYVILDLDKVYSRVNLNLEYFMDFLLLYMQTTEDILSLKVS